MEQAKLLHQDAEWADLTSVGKDVDKIVSYWSDDAVLIFPGQPVLEGKPAIRAYVEASLKTPGFKIHWVSEKPVFSPDGKVHTPASALNDTRAARPKARERRYPVLDTEFGVAGSLVVVDFHPIADHPRPDAGAMYMLGLFKVVDGELRIIDEIREFLPLGASAGW